MSSGNTTLSPSSESPSPTPQSLAPMSVKHNPDISDFFKSGSVRVVSDPEGYHVAQLANENKETPTNKILVLGDLLDYTLGRGSNFNNFATSKLTELRNAKSHSFESVKYCSKNSNNIKVMFGNRDLNKLKLMPLSLIDNQSEYIKYWEAKNGENYLDLAKKLITLLNEENINWSIPNLTNWKPFWSGFDKKQACKHWVNEKPRLDTTPKMSCLERFYLIFGLDCEHGTISAQNNIFGIAQECGFYENLFGKFTNILDNVSDHGNNFLLNIANTQGNESFKIACEQAAALVFVVYADSLYGTPQNNNNPFTGILREFFLADNTYYCSYAMPNDKDLLTFSHGGMRADFINCQPDNSKLADIVKQDSYLNKMVAEQIGGYFGPAKVADLKTKNLSDKIAAYNTEMKAELAKLFDDYQSNINFFGKIPDKATLELLLNLTISVPYKSNPTTCIHEYASPIMPGVVGYRNNPIVLTDRTLYQFIGHSPTAFAPLIDRYTLNNSISYLINLDISNTLMGQFGLLNMNNVTNNYSYVNVEIESGKLKCKSNTNIQLIPHKISNLENKTISEINIMDCNLLDLPVEFNKYLIQGKDTDNKDIYYIYHGVIMFEETNYYLFTYTIGYDVNIYLLPMGQVKVGITQFEKPKNSYKPPTKPILNIAPSVEERKKQLGLEGGKSTHRRRHMKTKLTGKCKSGANKLYVRTTRTLARRCKPTAKKTTGKKL